MLNVLNSRRFKLWNTGFTLERQLDGTKAGLCSRLGVNSNTHTELRQWKVAPRQLPRHRTSPSLYENSSRQICCAMLLAGAICGCPLRWEIRNRNDIYCCAASSRGNFAVTEAHEHQRDSLLRDLRLMFSANWAAAFLQSRWSAKKCCTHSQIQFR